jgi:NAD(P)-dependent dehydrogenase (short-subunit alcohol dehydrogenase family)
MMINLKNKIVVVLGGSGLLGKEFVKQIRENDGIAINADINEKSELEKHTFKCDITDEKSIVFLIENVIKKFGRIDGWINTAYPRTSDWGDRIDNISFDSFRKNVDMHMNGYFIASKLAIDAMLVNKQGSLINISSIYGIVGPDFTVYEGTNMSNSVTYAAIKGGIVNFNRFLSSYYGGNGIRVNAISPGGIFDNQAEPFLSNYNKKVPLKRMGTPQDIAPAAVYLLSDASSYVTGHNLIIDGGWTAI